MIKKTLFVFIFVSVGLILASNIFSAATTTYDNPLETDNVVEVIVRVVTYFYSIAIPLAIIMTIYVGTLFLTAGGNENQIIKARKMIIYLIIGITIILIGRGVITLIEDILTTNKETIIDFVNWLA